MQFICYPKCSTCQKAKKWLEENKVNFLERNIKEANPKYSELKEWLYKSDIPIKKFFNTSGLVYKSLGLKEKINELSEEEKLEILSADGMIVKRPILVGENFILIGFKENEWEKIL